MLATALDELVLGLGALLGRAPEVVATPPAEGHFLSVSTLHEGSSDEALAQASAPWPSDEGFVLLPEGPANSLMIIGGNDRGCLYGVFAFLRLLQLNEPLPAVPVVDEPAMALRILEHWDNLDGSVERGYAGRSIFFAGGEVVVDEQRLKDYGRLLASVGINALALNNVNVDAAAMALPTRQHLSGLARVAKVLRSCAVRTFLSVAFEAPVASGCLPTADPVSPGVSQWWRDLAAEVYSYIPDLGGFIVKAGSEGRVGPGAYGRTHAEGANVMAAALEPFGGIVIWRAFVYNCSQDWRDRSTDRAKAAYEEFVPLDGHFATNAVVQVKAGPVDFQVREPPSPLLGAMAHTGQVLEVQLTQEYTGQQVHVCYLVPAWKEVLDFGTYPGTEGATISRVVCAGGPNSGMAGVANVGDEPNWTGHHLAQANLYGFGRLAWSPQLEARLLAEDWARLTFGPDPQVCSVVSDILMASRAAYESYTSPLGLGWMVVPGAHYGPSPDGYEYSRWGTYHFSSRDGTGVDRTRAHGTGFTAQYREPWRSIFESAATCPEELLLFFHHLPYSYRLRSGKTLVQQIYDSHFDGAATAEGFLSLWRGLEGKVDVVRFGGIERRLALQASHAADWRDVVNSYFFRKSGVPDEHGRPLY